MKKVILNLSFLATIIGMPNLVQAKEGTSCLIYLTSPCRAAGLNSYFAPKKYFKDVDGMANLNAGRCIERVQEYKSWCGSHRLEAYAVFQVSGRNVIGAYTHSDGKSYINDGVVGRYTGFSK